ncbi:unnamed protein product, partial [Brassica rapa subsp. trilocularis]
MSLDENVEYLLGLILGSLLLVVDYMRFQLLQILLTFFYVLSSKLNSIVLASFSPLSSHHVLIEKPVTKRMTETFEHRIVLEMRCLLGVTGDSWTILMGIHHNINVPNAGSCIEWESFIVVDHKLQRCFREFDQHLLRFYQLVL